MRRRFCSRSWRRVLARPEIRYPLAGWLLFIVSAGFFIAASIRSGDSLGLVGAVFFLLACFFFLPPLFAEISRREAEEDGRERDEEIAKWDSPRQKPQPSGRRRTKGFKSAKNRSASQGVSDG